MPGSAAEPTDCRPDLNRELLFFQAQQSRAKQATRKPQPRILAVIVTPKNAALDRAVDGVTLIQIKHRVKFKSDQLYSVLAWLFVYLTKSVSETQDDVDVGNLTWEAEAVARTFHSPSSLESSAPTSRTSQRPSGNPPRNSSLPPHTVPGAVCKF